MDKTGNFRPSPQKSHRDEKMRLAKFILRLEDFLLRLALGANARRKIYFASRIFIFRRETRDLPPFRLSSPPPILSFLPFLSRRISSFRLHTSPYITLNQRDKHFQRFKNRVSAPKKMKGRIYAILATRIYSLTFCQIKKDKGCLYKKEGRYCANKGNFVLLQLLADIYNVQ